MDNDLIQFVKKYNALATLPELKTNIRLVNLFIQHNRNLRRPLLVSKHNIKYTDWIIDNQEKINELLGASEFPGEFYLYPLQIKTFTNNDELPAKQTMRFTVKEHKTEKIIEDSLLDFPHYWKKLINMDNIYYRERKRKKFIYKSQLVEAFINIPLPKRGQGVDINGGNKKLILNYIQKYGYPFGIGTLSDIDRLSDLFGFFLHKWLRVQDLIFISQSPNFPNASVHGYNIGGYKISSSHLKDLLNDAYSSIVRPEDFQESKSKYIYDYYSSIYGLIMNSIISGKQKWKKCEYSHCDSYFLPQGKKKRGCCELHQNRIRAFLHRTKSLS
ncbi:MAG: hypothetical protein NTZ55_05310 [Candidatus Roizmanbacteria bacterium]|nr:hypothetical protein [Candidatus Roizmanbacteria bacterium]